MASEKIIPVEGIDFNISSLYLGPKKARLIKNLDLTILNEGSNVLVLKPLSPAELYSKIRLPEGENIVIGGGVSREINEAYVMRWNSLSNFNITRIKNGLEQIVFNGPEPKFRLDPSNYISPTGRIFAQKVCVGTEEKTYLYWVDGYERQRFLCVEDSIATNSFNSIQFPFFASTFYDREELISLGIVKPEGCVKINPVSTGDKGLNLIKERPWRFRISYIDHYGRPSEHGNPSDLYYTADCISSSVNCLDITFEAGGPLWEKYNIEVQRGDTTEWDIIDVLDKYEDCERPWYERGINKKLNYNSETNTITYRFCGGKNCIPIADEDSQRTENPMPIVSNALFNIGGAIALANNKYGFKPWSCDLKDKIKFEVEKPEPDPPAAGTRNITVWLSLYNDFEKKSQAIRKRNGKIVFGGLGHGKNEVEDPLNYSLYFGDDEQEGFIGYLAGTKYAVISEQYIFNEDLGTYTKRGVAENDTDGRDNIWLQKFEFKNVPPGKFVFRVASHRKKLSDPTYQQSSTYIAGSGTTNSNSASGLIDNRIINGSRELFIDVCNNDYDSFADKKIMVWWDITAAKKDIDISNRTRVVEGYVYETKDGEVGDISIEGADVRVSGAGVHRVVANTDHNGFYFCTAKDSRYNIRVLVRKDCTFKDIGEFTTPRSVGISFQNFYATDKWTDYLKELCNRVLVKGKIVECTTGAGLPGVTIGITNGRFITTNDFGEYELIVHDKSNNRTDTIIYMAAGKCNLVTCDNGRCFPTKNYIQPACSVCAERVVRFTDYQLKLNSLGVTGLQKGGRYAFALNGSDWMGRQNFSQTDPRWELKIPDESETQSFKYSRIKCTIGPTAVFPSWMKRLYMRFSKNLAYQDFVTWVVDRFEFIDNTGLANTVSPTQIKIYYSSLAEYAKQNEFAVNVNWQFIDEKNSLRIQDIVQFVANGDGVIFNKTITALVKYDKDGRYFLIDYTSDLEKLKEGAYIKLMRPSECIDGDVFYSLCKTIKIIDGKPEQTEFYLDAVDSYQLNRQIPTPVTIIKTKTKIVQNSNPVIYEEVEESETVNIIKPYSWTFEHDSPSDKWGTKATNRGPALSKNPYEDIICRKTEVAISGTIGVNGIVNYHHYFDRKRKFSFQDSYGGIIAAVAPQNILLFICENNCFVVTYDDNSIRLNSDGKAFAVSEDDKFSKPTPSSAANYGCQNEDRNTISFHHGKVAWFDSTKSCVVVHDFKKAEDISSNVCLKYLAFKSRDIKQFNRVSGLKRFWHGIISPVDGQYYLTDFNLRKKSYINDETNETPDKEDTLCFDLTVKEMPFRKLASFTPEFYLCLQSDDKESQLFSFKNGNTYCHNRNTNTVFNNFYGIQCQHSLRICKSNDNMKSMLELCAETYVDEVMMYGKKVLTESGQESMIPRNWFSRGENFWVAPLLSDINTIVDSNISMQSPLFDGERLRGRWVDILFVGDPDNLGKYFELTGIILTSMTVEKTGVK